MDPIIEAAREGSLQDVQRIVESEGGAKRLEASADGQEFGRTPLMWASVRGHTDVMEYLLKRVHVDQHDKLGRSALVLAADVGRLESVQLLLSKGASASRMSQNGWTPLMAASAKGHLSIVTCLLRVPGVEQVNRVNEHGITALWNACNRGRAPVVAALLAAGADPTMAVGKGKTPIKIATEKGFDDCARVLQEWERVYMLHKARRVRQEELRLSDSTYHSVPWQVLLDETAPWMRSRVMRGTTVPRFCIAPPLTPPRGGPVPGCSSSASSSSTLTSNMSNSSGSSSSGTSSRKRAHRISGHTGRWWSWPFWLKCITDNDPILGSLRRHTASKHSQTDTNTHTHAHTHVCASSSSSSSSHSASDNDEEYDNDGVARAGGGSGVCGGGKVCVSRWETQRAVVWHVVCDLNYDVMLELKQMLG